MFNHKSNLYFISGDNYYIKEGTSTWVIDKDGVCIASFYPFCPRSIEDKDLKRLVLEDCVTCGWAHMDSMDEFSPRLEKVGHNEFIVTKLEYTYTPDCDGKPIMFRLICAYIKDGKVLGCIGRSSVGIGWRICNEPRFNARVFRDEQLYALRKLYDFYFEEKIKGQEYNEEAKRRLELLEKMRDKEADWCVDKQWLEWHNTRMSGNGSFMHEFWEYRGNWGNQIAGILKLPKWDGAGVFPNVNAGVWTKDVAEKIHAVTGEKWHEVKSDGGMHSYTVWLHHEKSSTNLRFMIFHHYEAKDARDWVLSMCMYEPDLVRRKNGDFVIEPDKLASDLKSNPGWVGDMDFCFHPIIDDWGAEVENSEKRAVYFVRGNTGVALFSDNAEYDVLPIARAIDAELIKGIKQKKKK